MEITLEQVEQLRQKADVTYEEARAALEYSKGDLLDALIMLERQGKTRAGRGGSYTTRPGGQTQPPDGCAGVPTGAWEKAGGSGGRGSDTFWEPVKAAARTSVTVLKPSTRNRLELWRGGRYVTSMPILILLIALLCIFWIAVPLLILGLFLGYRYHFTGPDVGRKELNQVMDTVSDTVDDWKETVKREYQDKHRNSKQKKPTP